MLGAALLPYVWLLLSGVPSKTARARWGKDYSHRNGRDSLQKLDGWRQRAHYAQMNAHENFGPFAAALIIAALAQVSPGSIQPWVAVFFVSRMLHGIFYIADHGILRTAAWSGGALATVALLALALDHAIA